MLNMRVFGTVGAMCLVSVGGIIIYIYIWGIGCTWHGSGTGILNINGTVYIRNLSIIILDKIKQCIMRSTVI